MKTNKFEHDGFEEERHDRDSTRASVDISVTVEVSCVIQEKEWYDKIKAYKLTDELPADLDDD